MRLIFMGTPDFGARILKRIFEAGEDVVAVISQPDKPVGRHRRITQTPVKSEAIRLGIKVFQPEKLSQPDFVDEIRLLKPDVIVVAAYGKILPGDFLDIPGYGCINVHASLLPRWRGAAPCAWAVISGDEYSGVTIMQMEKSLDTGDILLQKSVKIASDETGASLLERLSILGGGLVVEALKRLEKGTLSPIKQDGTIATYAPLLKKEMGEIDWSRDARKTERIIRGLTPWPGSFSYYQGRLIKIIKAAAIDFPENIFPECSCRIKKFILDNSPGSVFTKNGRMFVVTGGGWLEILKLQPAGKNVMDTVDFLRGNSIISFDK